MIQMTVLKCLILRAHSALVRDCTVFENVKNQQSLPHRPFAMTVYKRRPSVPYAIYNFELGIDQAATPEGTMKI